MNQKELQERLNTGDTHAAIAEALESLSRIADAIEKFVERDRFRK